MISKKIKNRLSGGSFIRAMFEKGNELKAIYGADNVYDFTLGNPDVMSPDTVNKAIIKRVSSGAANLHGYMSNSGFPEVRDAVAEHESKGLDFKIEAKGVVMTVGAAGGINILFKSLLDPGDEVLTFAPYFVEYNSYVDNSDGKLIAVPPDTSTFQPDAQKLALYITAKTKAIIINTPNNPTGVVYSRESLEAINQVITQKEAEFGTDIYIISDEPYREIVYDGADVPKVLSVFKNGVVCYSYSKSLSLAGERIGYVALSPKCSDYDMLCDALVYSNRVLGFVNAPNLFQYILPEVINESVNVDVYKKRRDMLLDPLLEMGYECIRPQGAFYLFMKSPITDDTEFANKYALKHNILVVPGSGFGCPGFVRLAYCVPEKTITGALPHFAKIIKEL